MFSSKMLAFTAALLLSASTAYAADKGMSDTDKEAINTACTSDAAATGCTGKVVGKGLLICMHEYKKNNPKFKFSDGCKAAMKKGRADKMGAAK